MIGGAEGATQRAFDAFRDSREGGLAIERRKNGAADKGCAAQTGKDRTAEPLYGDATAVDDGGFGSIDGKRRLVAEINDPGLASVLPAACRVQTAVPQNSTGDRRDSCASRTPLPSSKVEAGKPRIFHDRPGITRQKCWRESRTSMAPEPLDAL